MVVRARCPLFCAWIAIALGGCDKLFSLTEIESDARVAGDDALVMAGCDNVVVHDDFDDNVLNAVLWEPYGDPGASVDELGGHAVLSLGTGNVEDRRYADLKTRPAYDLTDRRLAGRLVGVTDLGSNLQASLFARSVDGDNVAIIYLTASTIGGGIGTPGVFTGYGGAPYVPAIHQYLALRFDTEVHFESSADGITWNPLAAVVPPFAIGALRVGFYVYMDGQGSDPGAARFDDFVLCEVP